jgi:hypothetical protein
MKKDQLVNVAGTSKSPEGEVKIRFGIDLVTRTKALQRWKHTDINLEQLPRPMTKLEALLHLQSIGYTEGDAGYVIAAKVAEKSKLAKKGEMKISSANVAMTVKSDTPVETV